MSKPPRHLVLLGGTGFVGSHLLARWCHLGGTATVLSRNRDMHGDLRVLPGVRLINADVYKPEALAEHFREADAVVNLVGILNEKGFGGRGFRRAHVELTEAVISACHRVGCRRLLQMSSLNAGLGHSHYLRTRGEAEERVKASKLDFTLFQPSTIFGRGDGLYSRFAGLLRLAVFGIPLARANARMAPVFVGDVVEAMVRCLNQPETIGKTFQLYGPQVYTLKEIVRYTAEVLGLRRPVVGLPNFLGRLQALVFDFVPGKPFSTDNYLSLALDSVGQQDGLRALGIQPTPVEWVVPGYLGRGSRQGRLDHSRSHFR